MPGMTQCWTYTRCPDATVEAYMLRGIQRVDLAPLPMSSAYSTLREMHSMSRGERREEEFTQCAAGKTKKCTHSGATLLRKE